MRLAYMFNALTILAIPSYAGPFLIGAIEDLPGSSGYEKNGDFNDWVFSINGDASIIAAGGIWSDLAPGFPSETGKVFWDNPSLDGTHLNVGYCLLGGCGIPGIGNVQYLAGAGGAQLLNQTVVGQGTLTLTILGQMTMLASVSSLGWCNPADCLHTQHLLIGPGSGAGSTASFTPGGEFELYFSNWQGQFYGSRSADNLKESKRQQHFAFFSDPPSAVPEPAGLALAGLGLMGLGLAGSIRRWLGKKERVR